MVGISSKSAGPISNKNLFNGKEIQNKEFTDGSGLDNYDFNARMYNLQIGRLNTIDHLSEKFYSESPFISFLNNPLLFIDPSGNEAINISELQKADAEAADKLVKDLENKTGLKLKVLDGQVTYDRVNGEIVVTKNENGKAVGSKDARDALIDIIDSDQTIDVGVTNAGTRVERINDQTTNHVLFNIDEINETIKGTKGGLNSTTYGWALSFFHEYGHTILGGSMDDPNDNSNGPGDCEKLPNKIRKQLGSDYGQTQIYFAIPGPDKQYYMPFSPQALRKLNNGKIPTQKYVVMPKQ